METHEISVVSSKYNQSVIVEPLLPEQCGKTVLGILACSNVTKL